MKSNNVKIIAAVALGTIITIIWIISSQLYLTLFMFTISVFIFIVGGLLVFSPSKLLNKYSLAATEIRYLGFSCLMISFYYLGPTFINRVLFNNIYGVKGSFFGWFCIIDSIIIFFTGIFLLIIPNKVGNILQRVNQNIVRLLGMIIVIMPLYYLIELCKFYLQR